MNRVLAKADAELSERIYYAVSRYGPFASTHEALGVASEEWDELREAIRANDLCAIREEALDLAAVAFRLADACADGMRADTEFARRSRK